MTREASVNDGARRAARSGAAVVASALATTARPILARRKAPVFTLASPVMTIDGQTVPGDRFEEVNEPAV